MSQLVPFLNFGLEDSELGISDSDFFYAENSGYYFQNKSDKMFITSLEGLNSGVPTRTTPTVTPTTLKNIEQTFIELQSTINETHENEAGFVPPLVHSIGNNQYISASDADIYSNKSQQSLWPSSLSQSSSDSNTRSTPPLMPTTNLLNTPQTTRRNMGGRKPTRDLSLSPEEEERRQIRRERNKQAAARCRKRRVDHTNALIKETEELEAKKQKLVEELHKLKNDEEQIKCFLEMHENSPDCRLHSQSHPSIKFPSIVFDDNKMCKRVKTEIIEQIDDVDNFVLPSATAKMLSSTVAVSKPNRPNFLAVGATMPFKTNMTEIAGIPISTPSTGMTFNFDSLMGGGTGLTPVSTPLAPSCSTQQRNIPVSMADVMSPDTCSTRKLVSL